jgi:hypothetical protein
MAAKHGSGISRSRNGHEFMEVGRFAPVMAAKHTRISPQKIRRICYQNDESHSQNTLLQNGLKLPYLSRSHMSNWPGICGKFQANYFLSYILRVKK